jgi:hypothetical protein
MRGFWIKLVIFVAPFAIGFSALTGVMIYIGESMPLRMVVWHQQNRDELVLWRVRYGNRDLNYKITAINMRQPDVLAIGSSRVLQMRAGFFNRQPDAFFNAGGAAWHADEVRYVLENVDRAALPEILIFGIDPPWFVDGYDGEVIPRPVSDFSHLFTVNRSLLQDVINDVPFNRSNFDNEQYLQRIEPGTGGNLALGMRAIRDGQGFRADGSEQFGDFLVAGWLWDVQQRDAHIAMMQKGEYVYPYGAAQLDADSVREIRDILDFAQAHDIFVIGFLPSYEPQLWDDMRQSPDHQYVPLVDDRMRDLFAEYDYPFFDYSDGEALGLARTDFFDGWHASERGNLVLYLDMLAQVPQLQTYSDAATLRDVLTTATNTWQVFYP